MTNDSVKESINIIFNSSFLLNNSHENLENLNGMAAIKGISSFTSTLFIYNNDNLFISFEPQSVSLLTFHQSLPLKSAPFKNPSNAANIRKLNKIKNVGFYIKKWGLDIGYGDWNDWTGPGIHNTLIMSNNADGIPKYFVKNSEPLNIFKNIDLDYKYSVFHDLKNKNNVNYYLSLSQFVIKHKNTEIGINKMIYSGGNSDIDWKLKDAINVIHSSNKIKHWDVISEFYVSKFFERYKLKTFFELGGLNRPIIRNFFSTYQNNTLASVIGIRKYGIGLKKNLLWGVEYLRTVQGPFYDRIPTPNWYSNRKYNFSINNNRYWAAHSGPDSDDFLFYFGFVSDISSLIYAFNYERHGVTYHFPPEIKFEHRFTFARNVNNFTVKAYLEFEKYEHYGFVDSNPNVWNETFENGSIQRSLTVLFSIEKRLF